MDQKALQDAVDETPSRSERHKQTSNLNGLPWISKEHQVALLFLIKALVRNLLTKSVCQKCGQVC